MKKQELLIKCDCGGYHFVEINYDKDFDHCIWISVIDNPNSLLDRIKNAFKVLFGKKVYWTEVLVEKKDIKKLQKLISNFLEQK